MNFSPQSWVTVIIILLASLGIGWWAGRKELSNRTAWIVVAVLTVLAFSFFSYYSIWLYTHFEAHARDLSIFDQAIYNLSRFRAPASTIRGVSNLLSDHFHPIIFILTPFYWIVRSPVILLVAQAACFSALLPLTYLLGRQWRLPTLASVILGTAVVANVGNFLALSFDFHEIAFAAPLFLFCFIMALRKKWRWYWVCLGLLILTKESMPLYALGIGGWLLTRRHWRQGAITIVVSLVAFALITKVFIPALATDHQYFYNNQYGTISSTTMGVPLGVIRHPLHAIHELISRPEKLGVIKMTLGSYAFLPVLAVPLWPLTLLTYAERFWSVNTQLWFLQFHYQVLMNVVLATGTLMTLGWLVARWRSWAWLATSAAVMVLGMTLWVDNDVNVLQRLKNTEIRQRPTAIWTAAVRSIPSEASVSAQDAFGAHLSDRRVIYTFPTVADAEWIILDPLAPRFPMSVDEVRQHQARLRQDPAWVITFDRGSTTVFRRR